MLIDKKATDAQALNEKKETTNEKHSENRSPPSASLADPLLNTMAFSESVQEEIKGENDALILGSHDSEVKPNLNGTALNDENGPKSD